MINVDKIDLTDEKGAYKFLCQISKKKELYLSCYFLINNKIDVADFIKDQKIILKEINLKKANIYFYHVTTQIDNLQFIKENGLIDAKEMLKLKDSPMVKFLDNNEISINIEKKLFVMNRKTIKLEQKTVLYYDDEIEGLYVRLYTKLHSPINGFIYSENPMDYSCVKNFPEIIQDIEKIANKKLTEKWKSLSSVYLIKAYAPLADCSQHDLAEKRNYAKNDILKNLIQFAINTILYKTEKYIYLKPKKSAQICKAIKINRGVANDKSSDICK